MLPGGIEMLAEVQVLGFKIYSFVLDVKFEMLVKHTALGSYPTSTRSGSPGEEPEKLCFEK